MEIHSISIIILLTKTKMSLEVITEKLHTHLEEDKEHKKELKMHIEAKVPYKTFGTMIGIAIVILGYMATQMRDLNSNMAAQMRDLNNNISHQQEIFIEKYESLTNKVGSLESRLSKVEGLLSGAKVEIK